MNGGGSFFVDTNVILYSLDSTDRIKQERAERWLRGLWEAAQGRVSWQVLQEFYSNARKRSIPEERARRVVAAFSQWRPPELTIGMFERAWHWCDQARLNFWDAMILAAAERANCRWLLSEDFQPDRTFGSITLVNPFQRAPQEFGLP